MSIPPCRTREWHIVHPTTLQGLLETADELALEALREGRVFINGRRAQDVSARLEPGTLVVLHAPAPPLLGPLDVVADTEGIIVCNKPPWASCEPDATGYGRSLREHLEQQLGRRPLHVVTRLDVGVSGLVVLSGETRSHRHLQALSGTDQLHREYQAILEGTVHRPTLWQGAVDTRPPHRNAQTELIPLTTLVTELRRPKESTTLAATLALCRPTTGRRHQIRIHASRARHPIFGDVRYGGLRAFSARDGSVTSLTRLALHAARLSIPTPSGRLLEVRAAVPQELVDLWQRLGGCVADFDRPPQQLASAEQPGQGDGVGDLAE